jgi:hypothetical protein
LVTRKVTFISSDNEHVMAGKHLLGLCSSLLRDILCGVGDEQVFISVTASSKVVESALAVLRCEISETVYNAEVYQFLVDLGMSDITDCMENISSEKNDQTEERSGDDHDYNSSPEIKEEKIESFQQA